MKFLIDNILFISIILFLIIQLVYWIVDKIKTKKAIKELEVSIKSLRESNHKILNLIHGLQLKSYYDENVDKIN